MTHRQPPSADRYDPRRSGSARAGRLILATCLAYALFVVYGSLVPLQFRPMPLQQAWRAFQAIPFLQLGIGQRADWVANVLLFIPLSFLWLETLAPRRAATRLAAGLVVLGGCTVLSLVIEFVQLFFPPRTVSQNDVIAESLGALIGALAWWWRGGRLRVWLATWRADEPPASLAERGLWIYLAGLFVYNLLPLDLTISPVEIFHKWSGGAVTLVPFSRLDADAAHALYGIATDILLWVPVPILWVLSGRMTALHAWLWSIAAAIALELGQLLVVSRITDVTDILTATAGAGLAALALRWVKRLAATGDPGRLPLTLTLTPFPWILLGLGVWSAVLLLVFWYPFDFRVDRAYVVSRVPLLLKVPFHYYYFGSEYRAATELLHKLLFPAPIGVLLALGLRHLPRGFPRGLYGTLAVVLVLTLPALIEAGQLALPAKVPDSTDWMLETLAIIAAYTATRRVERHLRAARRRLAQAAPPGT